MARDNNIYGQDDSGFAVGIANKALSSTKGDADVWGEAVDQAAQAKGNADNVVDVKIKHLKDDTTGKRSEGN